MSSLEETPRAKSNEGGPTALVVGAGPVGLLAASELIRHGLDCRVVDPKAGPTPTDESRALAVHARTLEILDTLGEAEAFLARGRAIRGTSLHRSDGGIAATVDVAAALRARGTPFPMILSLPQGRTERLLLDRLRRLGGSVEWGTRLSGLQQNGAGVLADLETGTGATETFRADWLIGCDGAHSAVRHALGLSFSGAVYAETFYLTDATLDWKISDDHAHLLPLPDGPVLALPLPDPGRWRLVALSGPDVSPGLSAATDYFQGVLRRGGFASVRMTDPTWASTFRIHRRVVDRFRVGRCLIAGDAAHIHSPAGGQGMNTGLQDAMNLAWKVGLVASGVAPEGLLDSYEAERRPVVAGVLRRTDRITRLVTLRNPVAKAARDAILGLVTGLAFVRRRAAAELSQLDVNYEGSPIVAEDAPCHAPGPRPGDRAPDLALGEGVESRFYQMLRGTEHTLLLFPGAPADAPALARASEIAGAVAPGRVIRHLVTEAKDATPPPGASPLHDPEGRIRRGFGVSGASLYLIRPDTYVGYRALPPDPTGFERYLTRVFRAASHSGAAVPNA
ncbi:MAG: FAD-dependent monooxygenase [Isosphaeraceae bacterium]